MAQKTSEKFLSPMAFISFIRSVLQREAILHEKIVYFEKLEKTKKGKNLRVDAIAPYGYGEMSRSVLFEIKGKKTRGNKEISNAVERLNDIETNVQPQIVIIVNDWCEENEGDFLNARYSIWSLRTIEKWRNEYPIEYRNAYNIKEADYSVKLPTILDGEFDKNNIVCFEIIEKAIKEHEGVLNCS